MTTAVTTTTTALVNSATHRQVYVTVYASATPTEPTEDIIYDPTTTPYTTSGAYVGTRIRAIKAWSSCAGTSGTMANIGIFWDATTAVLAAAVPCNGQVTIDAPNTIYQPLMNQGGTGVTGKLGLTATGLVTGDCITIILDIING